VLENKSGNISETRKDRGQLLWTAYRNSPTHFPTVPSLTPYGLPFPKIGGLQLSYPRLSQEQVKLRTSNLAGTFIGPIQVKAHSKFRRKRSVGISRDCPFFEYPLLSREYSCSIVTKPLSPALFEILGPKDYWVTTLTFLGHVTSSVT